MTRVDTIRFIPPIQPLYPANIFAGDFKKCTHS